MFKGIKERFRNGGVATNKSIDQLKSGSVGYGLDKLRKNSNKGTSKNSTSNARSFSAPVQVPDPMHTATTSPRTISSEVMSNVSVGDGNRYYIYDAKAYLTKDESENFNIFDKPNGITPTSSRYVVQALTNYFRDLMVHNTDSKLLLQVFKPNLHHFSPKEVLEVRGSLMKSFPYDGCSLKGEELVTSIKDGFQNNVVKITMALRILWNSFPQGVVPWDSYYKFIKWESRNGFPLESFHFRLSKFLPNKDYTFCAFAFLEFILCILLQKNKLMIDKSIQLDLIFTAGPTCFVREKYFGDSSNDDLPPVIKSYHNRGNALHRLFVGYIRSLNHEGKMNDFYLSDIFRIELYPPKPYKARSSKALTLTIPFDYTNGNDFTSLIYQAATAKERFYSSKSSFSKVENIFLDQFEEETLKVITTFFSESSNRYITTFDNGFNAGMLQQAGDSNENSKKHDDQYAVATWLQFAKEQNSFDELLKMLESGNCVEGGTLALGGNAATILPVTVGKESSEEIRSTVRIGKMDITEWIISSWKYEMFMKKVQNTLLIKLTKQIGECNWLVITCEQQQNEMNANVSNVLNDLLDSCYNESVMT